MQELINCVSKNAMMELRNRSFDFQKECQQTPWQTVHHIYLVCGCVVWWAIVNTCQLIVHKFRLWFYVRLYRLCCIIVPLTAAIMQSNKINIKVKPHRNIVKIGNTQNRRRKKFNHLNQKWKSVELVLSRQNEFEIRAKTIARPCFTYFTSTISGRVGQNWDVWENGNLCAKSNLDACIHHRFVYYMRVWVYSIWSID